MSRKTSNVSLMKVAGWNAGKPDDFEELIPNNSKDKQGREAYVAPQRMHVAPLANRAPKEIRNPSAGRRAKGKQAMGHRSLAAAN